MPRFTLKTLLGCAAVFAVIFALALMILRSRRDQAELKILRSESGTLVVSDASMIQIRNVATNDPYSWKWRLYVPPGTWLETNITLDGKYRLEGPPSQGGSFPIPSQPEGVLISVSVSPLVNKKTDVTLRLGAQTLAVSGTNLDPTDWLPMPDNRVVVANANTEQFDYDAPIRLIARDIPAISTDDWHPLGGTSVGLVVWAILHKE